MTYKIAHKKVKNLKTNILKIFENTRYMFKRTGSLSNASA